MSASPPPPAPPHPATSAQAPRINAATFSVPASFLLLVLLATALQASLGGYAGLLGCSVGMILLYWRRQRLRQRLLHWSARLDDTPPSTLRDYDPLIANIYRQHRQLRRQCANTQACFDDWQTMLNALPFALLRLDNALQLRWCNRAASSLLPLQPTQDMGLPLTNILREPAFVAYVDDRQAWPVGISLSLPTGRLLLRLVDDDQGGAVLLVWPAPAISAP